MWKRTFVLMVFSLVLITSTSVVGQKPWERPMKDWKAEDCLKIVGNSPWAHSFSDINIEMWTRTTNESARFGTIAPEIILRLYSSSTLRQGLIRLNEIGTKYDQLDGKGRATVDEKNRLLRECEPCKKYYVVVMMQPGSPDASRNLVGERYSEVKFEELKGNIFLTNDKNERRELVQFVGPKTESGIAVFYFERFDSSQKPLLSETSKKLTVNFRIKSVNERASFLMDPKVEFDVAKMIVNSVVDF